jgi:RimJ/RimL family protein N-acetyltransferase
MDKVCKIINDHFCWILEVDGQSIAFYGSWNVQYFKKHYSELGYWIVEEDRNRESK